MASLPSLDADHPVVTGRLIAANTFFLAIADIANKLIMFGFYVVIARKLSVEDYGVLSFALAFVTMLAVFSDLGLGTITARGVARDKRNAAKYVRNALGIKLVAAFGVVILIIVLVNILGYPWRTVKIVYITSVFVLETAFTSYFVYVFQGFERMHWTSLTRLLQSGILIVGALLIPPGAKAVEMFALLYVVSGFIAALFAFVVISCFFVRPGLSFDLSEWRNMIQAAAPVGITLILVTFYYWNGSTFLSKIHGDAAVGIYTAAYRLALAVTFLGLAFSSALYPVFSRLFVSDLPRLQKAFERALRYMTLLMAPIAVIGSVLPKPITLLVYGSNYGGTVGVLAVMIWWSFFACLNSLISNYFIAIDKPVVGTIQAAISLGVNVLGNIILIPKWGAIGAAIAIVSAEAIGTGYLFIRQLKTAAGIKFSRFVIILLLGFGAAIPVGVVALVGRGWNLLAVLVLSAIVYMIFLLLTGGINRQDLKFGYALLKKQNE